MKTNHGDSSMNLIEEACKVRIEVNKIYRQTERNKKWIMNMKCEYENMKK